MSKQHMQSSFKDSHISLYNSDALKNYSNDDRSKISTFVSNLKTAISSRQTHISHPSLHTTMSVDSRGLTMVKLAKKRLHQEDETLFDKSSGGEDNQVTASEEAVHPSEEAVHPSEDASTIPPKKVSQSAAPASKNENPDPDESRNSSSNSSRRDDSNSSSSSSRNDDSNLSSSSSSDDSSSEVDDSDADKDYIPLAGGESSSEDEGQEDCNSSKKTEVHTGEGIEATTSTIPPKNVSQSAAPNSSTDQTPELIFNSSASTSFAEQSFTASVISSTLPISDAEVTIETTECSSIEILNSEDDDLEGGNRHRRASSSPEKLNQYLKSLFHNNASTSQTWNANLENERTTENEHHAAKNKTLECISSKTSAVITQKMEKFDDNLPEYINLEPSRVISQEMQNFDDNMQELIDLEPSTIVIQQDKENFDAIGADYEAGSGLFLPNSTIALVDGVVPDESCDQVELQVEISADPIIEELSVDPIIGNFGNSTEEVIAEEPPPPTKKRRRMAKWKRLKVATENDSDNSDDTTPCHDSGMPPHGLLDLTEAESVKDVSGIIPVESEMDVVINMWTIVYKTTDQEYNVVPSSWLISTNCCKYPDRGAATVAKLAKELKPFEDEWLEMSITIEKRDIDDYDRAMQNVIRMTRGKKTVTESENEARGKGHPRHKKKLKSKISSSSPPPPPPPKASSSAPSAAASSSAGGSSRAIFRSPTKRGSPLKRVQNKCQMKSQHICFFENQNVTLETMAKKMCYLSKSVTVLRKAIQAHHEEIKDLLVGKGHAGSGPKIEAEKIDEIDDQEVKDLLANFPLRAMSDFDSLTQKVQDNEEYEKKLISALHLMGKKTSSSRFLTTVLQGILGDEIVKQISWKGQKRGGIQKIGFESQPICKVLMIGLWVTKVVLVGSPFLLECRFAGFAGFPTQKLEKRVEEMGGEEMRKGERDRSEGVMRKEEENKRRGGKRRGKKRGQEVEMRGGVGREGTEEKE
ncbi:hypothetical protein LSTR_LSTR002865 [Laodelphax striatellus]|uniref:DUF4806 domain-containing protein n=1 Tax=Laodelphax striatellus TaxID=195883 RepID=A0A482XI26_LAOST|nr:hypothetical protein LSTR_LSTR002865 [Laodelphax striatellus]